MRLLITNISQGSEAMHVTCGGTFYYCCARNLLLIFEYWSAFNKVRGKNIVGPFLSGHGGRVMSHYSHGHDTISLSRYLNKIESIGLRKAYC